VGARIVGCASVPEGPNVIEPGTTKNFEAPKMGGAKYFRLVKTTLCSSGARSHSGDLIYKHLAALRPGRFVRRSLGDTTPSSPICLDGEI